MILQKKGPDDMFVTDCCGVSEKSLSLAGIALGWKELSKQNSEPEVFRHQLKLFFSTVLRICNFKSDSPLSSYNAFLMN